jgi:hypothetical protein
MIDAGSEPLAVPLRSQLRDWKDSNGVAILQVVSVWIVRVRAPVPEKAFMLLAFESLVDFLISAWHLVDLSHTIALASVVATLDRSMLASFAVTIDLD